MKDTAGGLSSDLLASKTMEEAAFAVLTSMLAVAKKALGESPYASKGKLLRGIVHLRSADGYRAIVVLEQGALKAERVGVGAGAAFSAYLPSASAWRWVSAYRSPVAIDVGLGRVEPALRDADKIQGHVMDMWDGTLGRESTARFLERSSTHLYAMPLHAPAGIVGMVSLEADCRSAMGRPFIWSSCGELLNLFAFVAAPYLASRPPAAGPEEPETNVLLPVVGASMRGLVRMARVFAEQEEILLITGPTGAGKSRFARFCHAQSPRREGPFVYVDLLSIPDELQLGELFGWKKGAFSGATADNPGAVARAEGGTLFIDEIDKLSMRAQAGLLHVLEERSYRSLGDSGGERKANVRFLVGTNARLEEAVKAGNFREDLYYRVNVLPLRLPPLDERMEEIGLWAAYMVARRHQERAVAGSACISEAAVALLERRSWPGNLRQLDNVIRRAYVLALLDRVDGGGDVVLDTGCMERALAQEAGREGISAADGSGLLTWLARAADAFVEEAERRAGEGGVFDLDWADAFRGFVLGTAVRRQGGEDQAFRILGKGVSVEHRNHKKMLKRELERVADFCRTLGWEARYPFRDLE